MNNIDFVELFYFAVLAVTCSFGVGMVVLGICKPELFPCLWEEDGKDGDNERN